MAREAMVETERLVLSSPGVEDARAMTRFVRENRVHLREWEPLRNEDYYTEPHWERILEEYARGGREPTCLRFVLREKGDPADGSIVGQCTFSQISRGAFQAAYLGYGLDHRRIGQGLMGEALTAAIAYTFRELNLHRIMANYLPSNERSARLLERLGFVREGYARDYLRIAGRWQDHVLTSLTNPHWVSCD